MQSPLSSSPRTRSPSSPVSPASLTIVRAVALHSVRVMSVGRTGIRCVSTDIQYKAYRQRRCFVHGQSRLGFTLNPLNPLNPRQLTPRRGAVAHLGNRGCCVHIHTGNLSVYTYLFRHRLAFCLPHRKRRQCLQQLSRQRRKEQIARRVAPFDLSG